MKIDPKLFLRALGSSLPEDPSEHNHSKPIKCRCPLHAGEDTMSVMYTSDGNMVFRCVEHTCNFNGDAIALVCARFNVSIKAAVEMFKPGGMLASCTREPMSTDDASVYLGKANTQQRIKSYLSKCQQLLARNPAKCKLRPGLTPANLKLLPPEVGLLDISDDMPEAFSEFRKSKYKKANLITFPFTYNGEVTHVLVVDADNTAFRRDICITRQGLGVFGEDITAYTKNHTIAAFTDPVTASIYYGTIQPTSSSRPPVMAVSGFPLPHSFSGLHGISIVGTADAPITLDYLLSAVEADDIVEGEELQPYVGVCSCTRDIRDVKEVLYSAMSQAEQEVKTLERAIADEINRLVKAGKRELVFDAFQQHQPPQHLIEAVAESINTSKYDEDCLSIVRSIAATEVGKHVLGNKKTILSSATGTICAGSKGANDVMSNFGIRIDKRVRGADGSDYFVCLISPADRGVTPVYVNIPESTCSSVSRMRSLISKAFSASGQSPYIAMYDVPGVSWYDVMSKLAEGCSVRKEVTSLGVNDIRDIYFPNSIISTRTNEVLNQDDVSHVDEDVCNRYSAVHNTENANFMLPFKLLAEKCDNIEVGAFLAGLMHFMGHTVVLARYGRWASNKAKHLFFVETEPGCFDSAIAKLNSVFTDAPLAEISTSAPVRSLSRYSQLGTLPLICRIPRVDNIQRLLKAVDSSEFPIIGIVDSFTASALNGRVNAAYITPSNEATAAYSIHDKTVYDIRESFPHMLLKMCTDSKVQEEIQDGQVCTRAFEHMCSVLGIPSSKLLQNMCSKVFAGAGMSGVDSFFDRLHFGTTGISSKMNLCIVYGKPQRDFSFTKRGQHIFVMEDRVLIGKYVVDLVNKFSHNVFSVDQLNEELYQREMLVALPDDVDVDESRCWCIPREIYDEKIVRKPIQLDDV
jgi:hypothetical protein